MNKFAIKFDRVSKLYHLQQQRTLKELIPAWLLSGIRYQVLGSSKLKPKTKNPKPKTQNQKPSTQLWALKDVSFEIKKGETVGIIGPQLGMSLEE